MVGQSVAVLDEQFVRFFGQLTPDGGIAAISFARVLNMVPVGMVAQAAGVAAFPFLASLAASGRRTELIETTLRTARMTLFLGTGAAAAVLAVGAPGVRLVFQWGAFGAGDSAMVSQLLAVYALAIPAWGLHQVVSRSFYAERRMWPPVLIGTLAAAAAVPLSLGLVSARGAEGLVWASVLSMGAYTVALTLFWLRGQDTGGRTLAVGLGRSLVAGAAASAAGWVVAGRFSGDRSWEVTEALGAFVVGGLVVAVVFAGVARLLGSSELRLLWEARRGGGSDNSPSPVSRSG